MLLLYYLWYLETYKTIQMKKDYCINVVISHEVTFEQRNIYARRVA